MVEGLLPGKVKKPWGYEKIIYRDDKVVVKKIFVEAGHQLSMQYHKVKEETVTLVDGEAFIILPKFRGGFTGDEIYIAKSSIDPIEALDKKDMVAMQPYHIKPQKIHRFGAITDATFIEVSTTELDDVVRLKDDYGRGR